VGSPGRAGAPEACPRPADGGGKNRGVRHHYSVTSTGLPEDQARRFHTFEEANGRFEELSGQAREAGGQVREETYWRRVVDSSGSTARLALDDIGLVPCDAACGAG
jgi:hypothetical protein